MLGAGPFEFQLTRKYTSLFISLFNDIWVVRTDNDGNELNRLKVPIQYGPKDKYVVRAGQDPDLYKPTAIELPRMSVELSSLQYDPPRKQNTLLRSARANNSSLQSDTQYMGVPYDLIFDLNIYTRNLRDGNAIVEQILPFFTPDYTVSVYPIEALTKLKKDIPIVLNSVTSNIEYEGDFDVIRQITWNLNFTMKAYYYGPIAPVKIIRTVFANIFNDPSLSLGYVTKINLGTGNGTFQMGDTVFQGSSYSTATAYGVVSNLDKANNRLVLASVQGQFHVNNTVTAVSTNAAYSIESFDVDPLKLVAITITPDPADALPNTNYGYSTSISEWPNT